MDNCIFCKIIKGEIPSYTIYEDSKVKAFLDVNPNSNGHVLVVPKEHVRTIFEIDPILLKDMISTINEKIYPLLKERLSIEGLTIIQNNLLGQEVPHFHIHLIPRYQEDGIKTIFDKSKIKDIKEIYEKLK